MTDAFDKEILDGLARKLAVMDGQNPDGLYKVAGGSMPAWMGYRDHAMHVLQYLAQEFAAIRNPQATRGRSLASPSVTEQEKT